MKKVVNLLFIPFSLLLILSLGACKKEMISGTELDQDQLVAGRLAGTWAKPTQVVVPEQVSDQVFGDMRVVFTTDEKGYPASFIAKDCPIIFSNDAGSWKIAQADGKSKVLLTGVTPVDEMEAKISGTNLVLTFHMGWENTETGATGKGDFSVTLVRQ